MRAMLRFAKYRSGYGDTMHQSIFGDQTQTRISFYPSGADDAKEFRVAVLHITSPNLSFAEERSSRGLRLEACAKSSKFGAWCILACFAVFTSITLNYDTMLLSCAG